MAEKYSEIVLKNLERHPSNLVQGGMCSKGYRLAAVTVDGVTPYEIRLTTQRDEEEFYNNLQEFRKEFIIQRQKEGESYCITLTPRNDKSSFDIIVSSSRSNSTIAQFETQYLYLLAQAELIQLKTKQYLAEHGNNVKEDNMFSL